MEEEEGPSLEELAGLEMRLKREPYDYDGHIRLVAGLRAAAELERLRHARTKFSEACVRIL